jgi:hypothetical protein
LKLPDNVDAVLSVVSTPGPTVFAGDFNIWTQGHLDCVNVQLEKADFHLARSWPYPVRDFPINHVFVRQMRIDPVAKTPRTSQARQLFGSMNKQLLGNKRISMDIRKRLYQAIFVNIALWGCESWALTEANRAKLESFHHSCLRKMCGWTMWDIKEKTDHERRY